MEERSLADDAYGDLSFVRGAAVFEEEDALPGAEGHSAVDDGDDFAGASERHPDMARHVIGAFEGVDEPWGVFGDESFKEFFEVAPCRRVGVFHDDQAGAGVFDEDGDGTALDVGVGDDAGDLAGDFSGAFAVGVDGEGGCVCRHVWVNAEKLKWEMLKF